VTDSGAVAAALIIAASLVINHNDVFLGWLMLMLAAFIFLRYVNHGESGLWSPKKSTPTPGDRRFVERRRAESVLEDGTSEIKDLLNK